MRYIANSACMIFLSLILPSLAYSQALPGTRIEPSPRGSSYKRAPLGPELGIISTIDEQDIRSFQGRRFAVRIRLDSANISAIGRQIRRATVRGEGYDTDIDVEGNDDVVPTTLAGKTTAIDLDLYKLNKPNHLVLIVIKLREARLSFMPDAYYPIMNGMQSNATFRISKRDLTDWQNMPEAERLTLRKIRFFVVPHAGYPTESYNVGLVIKEASPSQFVIPVWVDPKIKNTG